MRGTTKTRALENLLLGLLGADEIRRWAADLDGEVSIDLPGPDVSKRQVTRSAAVQIIRRGLEERAFDSLCTLRPHKRHEIEAVRVAIVRPAEASVRAERTTGLPTLIVASAVLVSALAYTGWRLLSAPSPECESAQARYTELHEKLAPGPCAMFDLDAVTFVRDPSECADGQICAVSPDTVLPEDGAGFESTWGPYLWDMWARYRDENEAWMAHLERDANAVSSKVGSNRAVFVTAPAGYGKSKLLRGNFRPQQELPGERGYVLPYGEVTITIHELKQYFPLHEPDLKFGAQVINRLHGDAKDAATTERVIDTIVERHVAAAPGVLVLDGLDELHPKVQATLMYRLGDLLERSYERPLRVHILTRPEALRSLDLEKLSSDFNSNTVIELRTPAVDTTEALVSQWNNWILYRKQDRSVALDKNTSLEELVTILNSSPTACAALQQLITSNFVITHGHEWLKDGELAVTEARIQNDLLDSLAKRNKKSHDRPNDNGGVYMRALEQLAASAHLEFSENSSVFHVTPQHHTLEPDGPPAQDALAYSGFIDLNPHDTERFQFEPDWIGLELIRRRVANLKCDARVLKSMER